MSLDAPAAGHPTPAPFRRPTRADRHLTILSWNLLHKAGAIVDDVESVIGQWRPDLMLMQEATAEIDRLVERIGGDYARVPLPGRRHGLACWSRRQLETAPVAFALPDGAFVRRVCQIVRLPNLAIANVHLSHGQMLNRRQLRLIGAALPERAAVLGDFNLVGPALIPGFRDVGPRNPTHRMADLVPVRLDRCLTRGLSCDAAMRLPRRQSDHHPILVRLVTPPAPH